MPCLTRPRAHVTDGKVEASQAEGSLDSLLRVTQQNEGITRPRIQTLSKKKDVQPLELQPCLPSRGC